MGERGRAGSEAQQVGHIEEGLQDIVVVVHLWRRFDG